MSVMKNLSSFFKSFLQKSSPEKQLINDDYNCALDLGRTRILFLEGNVRSGKMYLHRLASVPLTIDAPLQEGMKILFNEKKCSGENIRMSLKSPQVVTRFLRFPKMTEKELRGVLQYEIEQYVPYDSKDLYLDIAVLQESVKTDQGENSEIFVAVAKKDYLDALLAQLQGVQANIETIDVDILACMKCLHFFHPEDFSGHTAILDVGVQVSTLGVLRGSQPRFIRDLSFGAQDVSKKLINRSNISDSDVESFLDGRTLVTDELASVFIESVEGLINDVKVSFDYYRDQSEDGSGADRLFICGLGSNQDYILKALEKALDVPVRRMDITPKIEFGPEVSADLFSKIVTDSPVALGLLLRDYD